MFYLYGLQDFVMKCECGNIARVGWPGMTCVCCESPRSGGSLEWGGGLVGLRVESHLGRVRCRFLCSFPGSHRLPPPSSAHPPPHLQLQLLAKQSLMVAVHLGGFLPLLHLHLQQLVILLLRICTEEEGGFVIISIKK